MGLDCGSSLVKYILCFFNFVIFLSGCGVSACGILIVFGKAVFKEFFNSIITVDGNLEQLTKGLLVEQFGYILIAAGALLVLLGFFGCCGALCENRVLLACYGIAIVLIFILEIAAMAMILTNKDKLEGQLSEPLYLKLTEEYESTLKDNSSAFSVLWDIFMVEFHCCGVHDGSDFEHVEKWHRQMPGYKVPPACCKMDFSTKPPMPIDRTCPQNPTDQNSYYRKGCIPALINLVETNLKLVVIIAAVVAAIEVVCACMAFCLCHNIGSRFIH